MDAETNRPVMLDEIIGHTEAKESLRRYLESVTFSNAIMLSGPPGIGKTTLALAAARTFGFDPLEINASRSIRNFDDVQKIKDACRSAVNIRSFLCGDRLKKTCVILDEIDGSDPHAQAKVIEWIRDSSRKVPILCTGNELPTLFKRNSEHIELIRCFPPRATDVESLFPGMDVTDLLKECQYDIRRMLHRIQYGQSDVLPKLTLPPTGLPIEDSFVLHQKMFELTDPLEYHVYKLDISRLSKTTVKYKFGGKRDRSGESEKVKPVKKAPLGKSRNSKEGKADS